MQCPNCKSEFSINAKVPDKQKMELSIKYEGDIISAQTVAQTIANIDKTLVSIGKDLGVKSHVFLSYIEQKEHEIKFGLLITGNSPDLK
jgi:hypothetical protein